ncbi:uncharacterized protein [Dermacentor andersoni]|uniref:uncharacterized protein isoform X1 n=1 Tax=Dermacentor andersoni TaxID=34620 RepID=UPI002417B5C7|nr:uncharacterized protein LOC126527194 isoform X1 [Dermacentor andersoni]
MKRQLSLVVCCLSACVAAAKSELEIGSGYDSGVQELRRRFLRESGYDASSRPTNDSAEPTVVRVVIPLSEVNYVALVDEWFTVALYFCKFWKDPRFSWDPKDYGGSHRFSGTTKEIWWPRVEVVNAKRQDVDLLQQSLIVYSDGNTWSCDALKVKTPCNVDLSDFPNDRQACSLRAGSSAYSDSEVKMTGYAAWGEPQMNASTEWVLEHISFENHTETNSFVPWVTNPCRVVHRVWEHTRHQSVALQFPHPGTRYFAPLRQWLMREIFVSKPKRANHHCQVSRASRGHGVRRVTREEKAVAHLVSSRGPCLFRHLRIRCVGLPFMTPVFINATKAAQKDNSVTRLRRPGKHRFGSHGCLPSPVKKAMDQMGSNVLKAISSGTKPLGLKTGCGGQRFLSNSPAMRRDVQLNNLLGFSVLKPRSEIEDGSVLTLDTWASATRIQLPVHTRLLFIPTPPGFGHHIRGSIPRPRAKQAQLLVAPVSG